MKNLMKIAAVMPVLLALLLAGCTLDDPSDPTGLVNDVTPADATTQFLTVGNSLTAGFMDSGLMKAGQKNSFGMLVATQMGVEFTQPWIDAPGIGTTDLSDIGEDLVAGVLYYTGSDVVPLGITAKDDVEGLLLAVAEPAPYHNLGVPGARLDELLTTWDGDSSYGAQFGKANSFFDFINRAKFFDNIEVPAAPPTPAYATASLFGQAIAKGPALSTVFIGGNDFLFGATTGDPLANTHLITDPAVWGPNYALFMGSYAGGLAQRNGFKSNIVVSTLPLVEHITFFLSKTDFLQVFGAFGFTAVETDYEYVLITDFLGWFKANIGGEMPTTMTLSVAEVGYLNGVIGAYNSIIEDTINGELPGTETFPLMANFGLVDINTALAALDPEATQHFLYLRAKYASDPETAEDIATTAARTYFSLDGVHPNNKGYVFMANTFLDVINDLTGASYAQIPLAIRTPVDNIV